jgi:hypothetical protein
VPQKLRIAAPDELNVMGCPCVTVNSSSEKAAQLTSGAPALRRQSLQ